MIKLGSLVKDNITGFSGVAVSRMHHLYGCTHIGIAPVELNAGRMGAPTSLDEQRVVVTGTHPAYENHVESNPNTMLGYKVKEKITGLMGIVSVYKEKLYGEDEIVLEPLELSSDGGMPQIYWIPVAGVDILEETEPLVSADASKAHHSELLALSGAELRALGLMRIRFQLKGDGQ